MIYPDNAAAASGAVKLRDLANNYIQNACNFH